MRPAVLAGVLMPSERWRTGGLSGTADGLNHCRSMVLPCTLACCMLRRVVQAAWWVANSREAQPAERPDLWVNTCRQCQRRS